MVRLQWIRKEGNGAVYSVLVLDPADQSRILADPQVRIHALIACLKTRPKTVFATDPRCGFTFRETYGYRFYQIDLQRTPKPDQPGSSSIVFSCYLNTGWEMNRSIRPI